MRLSEFEFLKSKFETADPITLAEAAERDHAQELQEMMSTIDCTFQFIPAADFSNDLPKRERQHIGAEEMWSLAMTRDVQVTGMFKARQHHLLELAAELARQIVLGEITSDLRAQRIEALERKKAEDARSHEAEKKKLLAEIAALKETKNAKQATAAAASN